MYFFCKDRVRQKKCVFNKGNEKSFVENIKIRNKKQLLRGCKKDGVKKGD